MWDSEGVRYEKPKLKIMGWKQSVFYSMCREAIKCFAVIMNETEEAHRSLLQTSSQILIVAYRRHLPFSGYNGINMGEPDYYLQRHTHSCCGALLYNLQEEQTDP